MPHFVLEKCFKMWRSFSKFWRSFSKVWRKYSKDLWWVWRLVNLAVRYKTVTKSFAQPFFVVRSFWSGVNFGNQISQWCKLTRFSHVCTTSTASSRNYTVQTSVQVIKFGQNKILKNETLWYWHWPDHNNLIWQIT